MALTRRLAAIMFTDMVGFTALTQANEQQALTLLDTHYRLLRPAFVRHHGREIKTIGDSFLIEFESALDATNCAVEIQRLVQEYDASAPESERFHIRIGVTSVTSFTQRTMCRATRSTLPRGRSIGIGEPANTRR